MALVLSMSVIVTLFGAPINASLTILIVVPSVACIALGFLRLLERTGGLDESVGTVAFYVIVAMYVIASLIGVGIMVYAMLKPVV